MKDIFKRISTLCLSLVLVAVLFPVSPAEAAVGDLTETGIVLWEDDFSQYTDINDVDAKYGNGVSGTYRYLEDGALYIGSEGNTSNRLYQFDVDVNIPMSYANMKFCVLCEAEISAPTRQYMFNMNRYCAVGSDELARLTLESGTTNKTTVGYEKVVLKYSFGTENDVGTLKMRLGAYGTASGYISVKNIKITLLPAEGTYAGADLRTAMAYDDAYAKLPSDLTVEGGLTLGANAVLDLNGHTLNVSGPVNAPAGAKIIDSSVEKTGKLVVPQEGALTFDTGATNMGQLPLWTGEGYILTDPQLGDSRAFFVDGSVSADGFTLDFRPGFGTVGGKNVREAYLANGACGITMDATLSWTDIHGTSDSATLPCDEIFTGMYTTANYRGRLSLTGAEKYQTISLGIALSSCGVQKSFTLPTFSNADNLTVHYTAQSLTYTTTGSNGLGTFAAPINTAEASKLVLDFNVQVPNFTNNDRFVFRLTPAAEYCSGAGYLGLFSHDYNGGQNLVSTCDPDLARVDDINTAETVNYRLEVDIATGAWVIYKNGVRANSGTYPDADGKTTTAAQILNGANSMVLRIQTASSSYVFSNIALYSVKTGA